jgi:hypothetical protein
VPRCHKDQAKTSTSRGRCMHHLMIMQNGADASRGRNATWMVSGNGMECSAGGVGRSTHLWLRLRQRHRQLSPPEVHQDNSELSRSQHRGEEQPRCGYSSGTPTQEPKETRTCGGPPVRRVHQPNKTTTRNPPCGRLKGHGKVLGKQQQQRQRKSAKRGAKS